MIPKSHAFFLRSISILAIPTSITGIIYGNPVLGSGVFIGSFLAQNHWNNPSSGWKRNIDMVWVQLLIWSHLYYVLQTPNMNLYYEIQILGALLYMISWYYQKMDRILISTICHASVHLCSNISLLIFYTREIKN